jgi:hypothetical protein
VESIFHSVDDFYELHVEISGTDLVPPRGVMDCVGKVSTWMS